MARGRGIFLPLLLRLWPRQFWPERLLSKRFWLWRLWLKRLCGAGASIRALNQALGRKSRLEFKRPLRFGFKQLPLTALLKGELPPGRSWKRGRAWSWKRGWRLSGKHNWTKGWRQKPQRQQAWKDQKERQGLQSWQARQSQRGQIILEYILLLVLSVSVALVVTKQFISLDSGSIFINFWVNSINVIADDISG